MKADVSIQQNEHMLLNNLLIIFLQLHTKVLLDRPPDRTWRRPPGHPQNKWVDQSTSYETIPPVRLETSGGVLSQSCPWVGLTHGLGRGFSVSGVLGWVHYSRSTKNLKGLC